MFGSEKDIRRNLFLFFIDGVVFTPAMAFISITTIIPFFLEQLGASTFQIAIAASMVMICSLVTQPFFGSIASRSQKMNKTFGKILLLQRTIFLAFVLSIPVFVNTTGLLIWLFLFFWGVFNLFAGSYAVFFTPLMLKLLPPSRRATARGIGAAVGAGLGVGAAAAISVILSRISFPYNYVLIFSLGLLFLLINAIQFYLMHEHDDAEPRVPMGVIQYIKEIPSTVQENKAFRAMIISCTFLVVANSLLSYYTLYAIRIFSATESHIAVLSALAVVSGAAGSVGFGFLVDRRGPKMTSILTAILVISAGGIALFGNSLSFLFVAWVFANLANNGYLVSVNILLGEVSPSTKIPLHVGVHTIISMALSSVVLFLLAPILENVGFIMLFATVLFCGILSLLTNLFVLRKYL